MKKAYITYFLFLTAGFIFFAIAAYKYSNSYTSATLSLQSRDTDKAIVQVYWYNLLVLAHFMIATGIAVSIIMRNGKTRIILNLGLFLFASVPFLISNTVAFTGYSNMRISYRNLESYKPAEENERKNQTKEFLYPNWKNIEKK